MPINASIAVPLRHIVLETILLSQYVALYGHNIVSLRCNYIKLLITDQLLLSSWLGAGVAPELGLCKIARDGEQEARFALGLYLAARSVGFGG